MGGRYQERLSFREDNSIDGARRAKHDGSAEHNHYQGMAS